ncbi:MAG: hypothetical protein N2595_08160 [bacterium]|nr:hypothetical protein [bacterium]
MRQFNLVERVSGSAQRKNWCVTVSGGVSSLRGVFGDAVYPARIEGEWVW